MSAHPEVPDDDNKPSRSDLKLYREAFNKEWAIAPEQRIKILKRVVRVLDDDDVTHELDEDGNETELPSVKDRLAIMAARTLITATGQNIRREAVEVQRDALNHRIERDKALQKDAATPVIDRDRIKEARRLADERRAQRESERPPDEPPG